MTIRRSRKLVTHTVAVLPILLAIQALPAAAQEGSAFEVETVAEGLASAWGMAFLPGERRMLVTERPGRLALIDRDSGERQEIGGVPEVAASGQGGLLDVALHPEFEENRLVYLTYSGRDEEGHTSTYLGRGRLDDGASELADWEVLFNAEPHLPANNGHYGSRIAFDGENRLYMTVGDRQSKDFGPDHYSQDLSVTLGATLRLNDDGSIPDDNPFVGDEEADDAIWSYGHRNSQGMAFHPETGDLWQNEHGEFNGDEINIIEPGQNYGWPIATYGVDYRTRERFAETPPENPETVEPVYHWEPDHPQGFPPSGLAFYEGDAFPEWQGSMFMGNLAHQYLGRFTVDGREVAEAERLLEGEGWRIRDVAVAPDDGLVYVLIDDENAPLIRLRPEGG